MAEEVNTEAQVEEQPEEQVVDAEESSGSKSIIVKIMLGLLLLLLFIGAVVLISWVVYSLKDKHPDEDAVYQPMDNVGAISKQLSYDFGQTEFRISLDPREGQTKPTVVLAKLALTYSEEDEELGTELANRKDQMIDMIQSIIAKKDPEDLKNNMYREDDLSVEIIAALNPLFGGEYEILGVYMPKFEVIEQDG